MAIQIYRDSCSPCIQIARHAILGNSISILFDGLLHSLQVKFIVYFRVYQLNLWFSSVLL